jgi:hypothetical protein
MNHFVNKLALSSALVAALLTGLYGAWTELPVLSLGLRAAVCAAVVYGFLRLGGELAGKSILRGLAEHQVRSEEQSSNSKSSGESRPGERKAA